MKNEKTFAFKFRCTIRQYKWYIFCCSASTKARYIFDINQL